MKKIATILPASVTGTISPYTTIIVDTVHHAASSLELIYELGCPESNWKITSEPEITIATDMIKSQ